MHLELMNGIHSCEDYLIIFNRNVLHDERDSVELNLSDLEDFW